MTTVDKNMGNPGTNTGSAHDPSASDSIAAPDAKADDAGVLPTVAPNDEAHTWGDDRRDHGHDEWLRENKPPHWG